ncbi:amidohydrolase [Myxococcus sp. AS-1-15]|uniref:amidohydrolase n=1 Tax=Myxococcus sp. AS-1-15 TaxID=2874600 RepID=UPI001CBF2314|nr:amidohydrolase family protein [Myxococcus sp. AS-1-15]MBZ4398653.1 amidohydrolase family protein [Myxococcus sp. AS-1-15]
MRLLFLLLSLAATAASAAPPTISSSELVGLSVPVCTGDGIPSTLCGGRDVVYYGGRIWTGVVDEPVFEQAMLVRAGTVVIVGTSAQVTAAARPSRYLVNLQGRVVLPGLVDAHSHVAMLALKRWTVGPHPSTWAPTGGPSMTDIAALVGPRAATAPPGEPIVVFYGAQLYGELRAAGITARAFLDALAPRNPVYALEWSGHAQAVNSVALDESGLRDYQPDPYGGWVGRDALGRHNGLLQEFAVLPAVEMLSSRISDAEYVVQHDAYAAASAARGLTTTANVVFVYSDERDRDIRAAMRRPGAMVPVCIITHSGKLCSAGPDGVVRRKVFADGTPVARSAFVSIPYLPTAAMPEGFPANTGLGLRNMSEAQFDWALQDTVTRGGQLLVHAIGDAGVEQTLSRLEARPDVDWSGKVTLEHANMASPSQVARAAALGITFVREGTHLVLLPPMMMEVNDPALYAQAEPLRSLYAAGVPLALGSDAFGSDPLDTGVPVAPNPWLDVMLTVVNPYYRQEAISVAQALGAYTRGSARARLLPNLGTLAPGKDATFFLPSVDPFSVTPDVLPAITSCLTVVSGSKAHLDRGCFGVGVLQ